MLTHLSGSLYDKKGGFMSASEEDIIRDINLIMKINQITQT